MKKINILIIIICTVFLTTSCLLSPEGTPSVELTLNKTVYKMEESIDGKFTISNNTDDEMKFNFNDAKKYGIRISGSAIQSYEINRVYTQALTSLIIKANDKVSFQIRSKLRMNDGSYLEKGKYSVTVYFDIDGRPNSTVDFVIE